MNTSEKAIARAKDLFRYYLGTDENGNEMIEQTGGFITNRAYKEIRKRHLGIDYDHEKTDDWGIRIRINLKQFVEFFIDALERELDDAGTLEALCEIDRAKNYGHLWFFLMVLEDIRPAEVRVANA